MKDRIWRFIDAVAVILIAVVALSVYKNHIDTIGDYFEVESVEVSDMIAGEAGRIDYARTVYKPFFAKWSAKVYKAGTEDFVCTNTGKNYYEPLDKNEVVDLEWYFEKDCNLQPGSYYIVTTWVLDRGLKEHNISNIFRVKQNRTGL